MSGEATARPWAAAYNGTYWQINSIADGWNQQVGDTCASGYMYQNGALVADHSAANAELIVRAVNSHDDLVAALNVARGDLVIQYLANVERRRGISMTWREYISAYGLPDPIKNIDAALSRAIPASSVDGGK